MIDKKRELGQYYTENNPFKLKLFREWITLIEDDVILEPFAGKNNIPRLMKESGYDFKWRCYDIEPASDDVLKRDTIEDFPIGYNVCITNCPYLGKSSARRRNIDYQWDEDDLYKVCLNKMLTYCSYVAAIIPESFITQNIHRDRLYGIIQLECQMFNDTDCPVCLAMFVPYAAKETKIYSMDNYLGTLEELTTFDLQTQIHNDWTFNDKNGSVGVKAVDSKKKADCRFMDGNLIDPEKIKYTNRSFTRISGLSKHINKNQFISKCNEILQEYRLKTKDIMLTSFKGLRSDGKFRRRLDWSTIRKIMDKVLEESYSSSPQIP